MLRGGETGLSCCTSIMDDDRFLSQLETLMEQQRTDFYKEFGSSLDYWKNRDFDAERLVEAEKLAKNPDYKPKNLDRAEKKQQMILRKDEVFCSKPWKVRGGSQRAQEVTNIAYKVSVTQIIDQTKGRTGHQILQILPNNATKQQIIHVLASMRAAVPADTPCVFTVHKDLCKNNLHIQGWVSTKAWDFDLCTWKERQKDGQRQFSYFESEAGFLDYQQKCKTAMLEAGLKFEHADDKTLPRVTDSHRYVSVLLKERPKADFISGAVKEGVRSEKVRMILDQIGARTRAIEEKKQRKSQEFYDYFEESTSLFVQPQKQSTQHQQPSATSSVDELYAALQEQSDSRKITLKPIAAAKPIISSTSSSDDILSLFHFGSKEAASCLRR